MQDNFHQLRLCRFFRLRRECGGRDFNHSDLFYFRERFPVFIRDRRRRLYALRHTLRNSLDFPVEHSKLLGRDFHFFQFLNLLQDLINQLLKPAEGDLSLFCVFCRYGNLPARLHYQDRCLKLLKELKDLLTFFLHFIL
ncbi:hypothetical protein ES703_117161 [subsurface metagenome]